MQKLLNIYKPKGFTPLQTINQLREKFPEYKTETIGFAGRLDPLAHGVLLLMVGEETTKEKDKYLNLPKEYEFEAVFGVATDTYDTLGILQIENCHPEFISGSPKDEMLKQVQHDINKFIKSKLGKQKQQYPPYSSKTVHGKPLYQWARENKLAEIQIPEREIEIYNFLLLNVTNLPLEKLKTEILQQINSVDGDFRQKEIKKKWDMFFAKHHTPTAICQTARFKISCSSGTYVRSLVHEMGEKTGMGAISLEILRTKIDTYGLENSLHIT